MKDWFLGIYVGIHLIAFSVLLWKIAIKPLFTQVFNIFSNNSMEIEKSPVISMRQANFLAVTLVISTADVFLPRFIAMDAGRDAWLAVILSGIQVLLLVVILLYFLKKFPDKNFAMIIKESFSPIVSIPILALLTMFLIQKASLTTRELGEVVLNGFLSDTPITVIEFGVLVITGYAVKKGLQSIARSNDLLLSVGILTLSFVIFMLFSNADLKNFLPVLENGIKPVLKGSLPSLPWLGDLLLLLCLVYPNISSKKKVTRYFSATLLFLVIALESGTLAISIFGLQLTQKAIFPALEMVRAVRITDFLERLEVPLVTVWIAGIFVKLGFVYYAITDTLRIWLGLKNRYAVVWPVGFMIFGLCIQPFQNIAIMLYCSHKILPLYTLAFYFLVIFLLIVVLAKKRLNSSHDEKKSLGY